LQVTGDSCSKDDRHEGYNSEFEDDQEHGALNANGISVLYNKREMYFTNREMIAKRMNETLLATSCFMQDRIKTNKLRVVLSRDA
jgi:hypothetical protein